MFDLPPDVPPQYAPVLVAEAPKQSAPPSRERTIGVCQLIASRPDLQLSSGALTPVQSVSDYFNRLEGKYLGLKGTTTLLLKPKNGELESDADGNYAFFATPNYIGSDQATFLVEIGGYKVKVIYQFNVMSSIPHGGEQGDPYMEKQYCPNGYIWKISIHLDEPSSTLASHNHRFQPTSALTRRRG